MNLSTILNSCRFGMRFIDVKRVSTTRSHTAQYIEIDLEIDSRLFKISIGYTQCFIIRFTLGEG